MSKLDQIAELAACLAMVVQANSGAPPRIVKLAHKIIELANEEHLPAYTLKDIEERYFGRIRTTEKPQFNSGQPNAAWLRKNGQ